MIVLSEAALAEFWDSINLEPLEPTPDVLREIANHYCRLTPTDADTPLVQPRLHPSKQTMDRLGSSLN
jgi:hypothetical protein